MRDPGMRASISTASPKPVAGFDVKALGCKPFSQLFRGFCLKRLI